MDLQNLRLFVEVARRGSFAAVARDRHFDPTSVSRAVATLEAELGFRLFQRTTRRMALTEAGALYLERVEALVDELGHAADAARAVQSGPIGNLRLTTSVAFGQTCIVPLLPAFRAAYPALKLELLLTDANLGLIADRIDLAIRLGPRSDDNLIGVKLFDTRYRVCASPAWLDRAGPLTAPEELEAHSCLLFDLPDFRTRWLFRDGAGRERQVAVQGEVVISNALALRDCCLAGMGPALLADWLIDEDIAAGRLCDLFPDYQVTATDFETAARLLYPSRAFLPNKVRVAIDFLRDRLARRPVTRSRASRLPRSSAQAG